MIQTLKGFRDFLPEEALKRQWLEGIIRSVFEGYGFDPVETPTLEPLELFTGQIGEDEKLFYKFKDAGGRNVALRYDQTVPICRVVGQYRELLQPFRRYQVQTAFRAEKPQKGRYREFLQCDADIFGSHSPLADTEVIALSIDIYKTIGFKNFTVLINDRSLLKEIPYAAIVSIDKLEKIGPDSVISEMIGKGIEREDAENYLSIVGNLVPNETITQIFQYLKAMGFSKENFKFQPTLARSFSYSTGPIWEVVIDGFTAGSVLGGERYDELVKKISGLDIPGTGFGLGFDRTLEAAAQFNLVPQIKTKTKVLVTVFSPDLISHSLKITSRLRDSGVNSELYPDPNAKLDKQIKYADKKGIPYVAILGKKEVEQKVITIKNLSTGEQKILSLEEIIKLLKIT